MPGTYGRPGDGLSAVSAIAAGRPEGGRFASRVRTRRPPSRPASTPRRLTTTRPWAARAPAIRNFERAAGRGAPAHAHAGHDDHAAEPRGGAEAVTPAAQPAPAPRTASNAGEPARSRKSSVASIAPTVLARAAQGRPGRGASCAKAAGGTAVAGTPVATRGQRVPAGRGPRRSAAGPAHAASAGIRADDRVPHARYGHALRARDPGGDAGGDLGRRAQVLPALEDQGRHGRVWPPAAAADGSGQRRQRSISSSTTIGGVERRERVRGQRREPLLGDRGPLVDRRPRVPGHRRRLADGRVARDGEVARRAEARRASRSTEHPRPAARRRRQRRADRDREIARSGGM